MSLTAAQTQFVEALESDRYKQGKSRLKTVVYDEETKTAEYRHCCLGVATEEFILATGKGLLTAGGVGTHVASRFYLDGVEKEDPDESHALGTLPKEVAEWLGITGESENGYPWNDNPTLTCQLAGWSRPVVDQASVLNDVKDATYLEIAEGFRDYFNRINSEAKNAEA